MTPEERSWLEQALALSRQNNEILRGMRRSGRWAMAMHVLYWAVIIVLSFGAYYFIQPYISLLTGLSSGGAAGGGIQGTLDQAQNAASQLKDLLK